MPPEDEHIERRALLKSQDNSQSEPPDNPFAFTPEELGSKLYDGKDLKVLRDMGGLIGLAYGLRTDLRQGLRWDEDKLDGRVTRRDILEHIRTVHHLSLSQSALYMGGSSAGGFSDRRRVFGENKIPVRPPKNIFQLMWIAMHDKVIVRPFVQKLIRFCFVSRLRSRWRWDCIRRFYLDRQTALNGLNLWLFLLRLRLWWWHNP